MSLITWRMIRNISDWHFFDISPASFRAETGNGPNSRSATPLNISVFAFSRASWRVTPSHFLALKCFRFSKIYDQTLISAVWERRMRRKEASKNILFRVEKAIGEKFLWKNLYPSKWLTSKNIQKKTFMQLYSKMITHHKNWIKYLNDEYFKGFLVLRKS